MALLALAALAVLAVLAVRVLVVRVLVVVVLLSLVLVLVLVLHRSTMPAAPHPVSLYTVRPRSGQPWQCAEATGSLADGMLRACRLGEAIQSHVQTNDVEEEAQ